MIGNVRRLNVSGGAPARSRTQNLLIRSQKVF